MSEPADAARAAALDAFLALVAERGYGAVTLRDVGVAAGLGVADLYRLYRDKPALVAGFLRRVDDAVLAGTASALDPEETARDRLFDVMMRRYDALKPHREFLRQLRQPMLSDPILALSLAPVLRRSSAAMLEAAAIPSDGLAGAVQQGGLAALHVAVSRVFFGDESGDLSKTMASLDSRLKTAESWLQAIEKYKPSAIRRATETSVS